MSKYINADTAIQELRETIEKYKDSEMFTRTVRAAENMIRIIDQTPSADVVEVKHGKWEEDSGNIACSECHTIWLYRRTDFCPNCGADMRGETE